jgi:hypothetical protein
VSEFRFRKLERHRVGGTREKMTLAVPIPRSPTGKIYQYSPNPAAVPRLFQLSDAPAQRTIAPEHTSRIRRQPGPGDTICPYSGHQAADEEFIHCEDIEAIKRYIGWAAKEDVRDWLADMARDFNRRQPRGGLFSMSMEVKQAHNPRPLAIREDLLREMRCEICQREYGVYAIGLFCPDCGAPNLTLHFQRETELVKRQIALAVQQQAQGEPELAYRLMGNAHEDVLTAFEATLKAVYTYLVREQLPQQVESLCNKRTIGNAFQNLERTKERFVALSLDPFRTLTPDEHDFLIVNIQKRHVIGHNLGIADEHYNELTQAEQPGETVRLLGEEIGRFATICTKVIANIENALLPQPQQH